MSVLLITATIDSGHFGNTRTKVTDTTVRLKEYTRNLEKYIVESRFDSIVFAENSGYEMDYGYYYDLCRKHGKSIEFLYLPVSVDKVIEKGKSYGEAKLISDAFLNSKLINKQNTFYKVSGRIWIQNINDLIDDKEDSCFIAHNFMGWVLTSFFKIRTDTFRDNLLNAYMICDDSTDNCIEHVYHHLLRNSIHKIYSFNTFPIKVGVIGGSGSAYTKTKRQIARRNLLLKLNAYHYDKKEHFTIL